MLNNLMWTAPKRGTIFFILLSSVSPGTAKEYLLFFLNLSFVAAVVFFLHAAALLCLDPYLMFC